VKLLLRPYRATDLEAVLQVWADASRVAHSFLDHNFFEQERSSIAREHLPKADTRVAVIGNRVVGFIALLGNEVGALFVLPEYHGRGIGRTLVDRASEMHAVLEVDVFSKNSIGLDFYRHYGFVKFAEKRHRPTGQGMLCLRYAGQSTRAGTGNLA